MNVPTKKTAFLFTFLFLIQWPLSAQNDTLIAYNLYYDAKDFYYDGDYDSARITFQKALTLYQKLYGEEHKRIMKIYYQLGRVERNAINYKASLVYLQKSVAIAEKLFGYYSEDVGYGLQAIGNTYDSMVNPKKSSLYYHKSIDVFKKVYGVPSLEVGGAYMNIGLSNLDQGMYQNAEVNFRKALAIFKESSEPNGKAFNKIYLNMGYLYRQVGDYEKAIDFGKKALRVKLMNYDELHPSVAKYYGHIGKTYEAKGDFKQGLAYVQKMLELSIKSIGKDHPDTGACYSDLGAFYVGMGDFERGLQLYNQASRIFEAHADPGNPLLIDLYNNMGNAYEVGLKDYDKALDIYQKALDKTLNRAYQHQKSIAILKRRIANIQFKKGEMDRALLTIQEGLKYLSPTFIITKGDVYNNPSTDQTEELLELLKMLAFKSDVLETRYKKNNQIEDFIKALETSELAIRVIEKMRRSYLSESSRQFLNKKTSPIYEKAVMQAFALYYLTSDMEYIYKAFRFSEKSKASILWQSINERYAFEASGISQSSLDSINTLHQRIATLQTELEETDPEHEKSAALKNQLFELKFNYETVIQKLEKTNRKYFQLKYAQGEIDPRTLQQKIPNNKTGVIEYFYTDEYIFLFVITKNGLSGFREKRNTDLSKSVLGLRNENLVIDQDASVDYISNLNTLYDLLIAPIHAEIEGLGNLIIVPHGVLQLLSFEMLAPVSDEKDFRTLDYLLKNYNIQYTWSAALWANASKSESKTSDSYTGFAPGFGIEKATEIAAAHRFVFRDGLSPLVHSVSEVQAANKYFPGKVFTESSASESQFLEVAPTSKIIHLATHAIANDRFPMQSSLLFSTDEDQAADGFLYAAEIYNLNLNADLAVMSACNTGYGQFAKGEGVMSLGRAFLYAGCKSIVMSLWLANDQSTSSIMTDFYKYSSEGFSKDEALRMAKSDYLKQADALTAHPFFWANLVAVGDMRPLRNRDTQHWMLLLSVIVGIGFLMWVRGVSR